MRKYKNNLKKIEMLKIDHKAAPLQSKTIIMYQISSNFGRPVKKSKKKDNKNKKNLKDKSSPEPRVVVRLKWEEIENMTIENLDIYLTNNFKINQ